MNNNLFNEELVSKYLDNALSNIEKLDFENQLVNNPALREEFNIQKDIIDAIRESRRLELKSRLNNISVSTPLVHTTGFKAASVATISGIIGITTFFLITDSGDLGLSEIDLTQNQTVLIPEGEIPEVPETITPVESVEESIPEPIEEPIVAAESASTPTNVPKAVKPDVIQPEISDTFEENPVTEDLGFESPTNSLSDIEENTNNKLEVAPIKDKKNKFHYKFNENKLFLYGDFKDIPYEIIELNTKGDKKYFLYYEGAFYHLLKENITMSPLQKIEDDSVVSELMIIQQNKLR